MNNTNTFETTALFAVQAHILAAVLTFHFRQNDSNRRSNARPTMALILQTCHGHIEKPYLESYAESAKLTSLVLDPVSERVLSINA